MTDRPGLTRRDFMRLGLVAPASLVAACGWDGGPVLEPRLRAFSRLNDWVGEKILFSPSRLAPEYPIAQRTPVMAFPAYSITHNTTGQLPGASGRMGARGRRAGAHADAAHAGRCSRPCRGSPTP